MKRKRFVNIFFVILLVVSFILTAAVALYNPKVKLSQASTTAPPASFNSPTPVLAYYYIWYDSTSWDRAKTDLPMLGSYTSDDMSVMRQHIQEAKAAGITGFIVSWKSTDVLNRRLGVLAQVAEQENFKLAIIYQGLDFNRDPLPVATVASDLDYFIQHFSSMPVFQLFSKPMVIWSGTWKFSTQDIQQVTKSRRGNLLILASERDLAGYTRLANLVDGEAYYWSSVNPDTFPGYQNKLDQISQAVHQNNGLWIAPAAPGFDAQLIGGTTVVDRKNGDTLRIEINTAMASSPDALGIISWNEFSENSYIEPSQKYGSQYLDLLSQILKTPTANVIEFDSSIPDRTYADVIPQSRMIALGGLGVLVIISMVVIYQHRAPIRQ
jgi:hypothetical protein